MKKALMYLLLALGITLIVGFVGGAVGGFIAGFVDGFNNAPAGTSSTSQFVVVIVLVMIILWTLAMHWAFLRNHFASYSFGVMPKNKLWSLSLMAFVFYLGVNMAEAIFYNPLTDSHPEEREIWQWVAAHRWQAALMLIPVDVTYLLVLFGAVFRAVADWKPNANQNALCSIFAATLAIPFMIFCYFIEDQGVPNLMTVPYMVYMSVMVSGYMYLCTRSVLPLIIGSTLADVIDFLLIDLSLSRVFIIVGFALAGLGLLGFNRLTNSFRPID